MNIAVIGAGAMGCLYAGYLSRGDNKVYILCHSKEEKDKINNCGILIKKNNEEIITYPEAISNSSNINKLDLIIVFVKSKDTEKAVLENLHIISKETFVLTLQNGYGNLDILKKYINSNNIIVGTTSEGSTKLDLGYVVHAGRGNTYIGLEEKRKEQNDKINNILKVFNQAGFNTYISQDVLKLVWSKLIINVGINALTSILNLKNGELLDSENTIKLMEEAIKEAVEVGRAKGFSFEYKEAINKVKEVAIKTSKNKSSMLQDILNKKKTEIDVINGAVVKEGKRFSINTKVNDILTNLVKAMELNY